MTEELKTCDFYNEKICTLFSKYFGFNVECKNLFLSTIDCDIERECPIKRLEQENKQMKSVLEEINLILDELKQQYDYMTDYSEIKEIQDKINEVLK